MSSLHESLWLATGARGHFPALQGDLDVDVAIIGAGITGLTAAYMAKRDGKRVVVLERDRVAGGISGLTTAHLSSLIDAGYSTVERDFGKEGARLVARSMQGAVEDVHRIAREIGDGTFDRLQGYFFAHEPGHLQELRDEYEAAKRAGLSVDWESNAPLSLARHGAFVVHGQGQIHPVQYLSALARFVHAGDVRICEHTRVLRIDDGDLCRVHTTSGVVTAKQVVMATHTPQGLSVLHAAVAPYRSYAMAVRLAEPLANGLFWDTAEPYHYIRRARHVDGEHVAVIGGLDHKTGKGVEADAYQRLEDYVRSSFAVDAVLYRWSAQLYEPADHLPFIGRAPMAQNIYVATGYSGDGMTFGTLAGSLLADVLAMRHSPYADLYSPTRVKPVAMGRKLIKENADVARHFVGDRLGAEEARSLREVPRGEARLVQLGLRKIAAYRDEEGRLYALRAVCSHMRCIVHWNGAEKSWDCPCHGARYDVDGTPIDGPALANLTRYDVRIEPTEPTTVPDITPQPSP